MRYPTVIEKETMIYEEDGGISGMIFLMRRARRLGELFEALCIPEKTAAS